MTSGNSDLPPTHDVHRMTVISLSGSIADVFWRIEAATTANANSCVLVQNTPHAPTYIFMTLYVLTAR